MMSNSLTPQYAKLHLQKKMIDTRGGGGIFLLNYETAMLLQWRFN